MPDQSEAPIVLKPCPFCGGKPTFGYRGKNYGANVIECNNKECPCLPFTNALSHAEAIAAWNTRAPDPEAAEIIRLCEEALRQIESFAPIEGPTPPYVQIATFAKQTARLALAQIKGQNP